MKMEIQCERLLVKLWSLLILLLFVIYVQIVQICAILERGRGIIIRVNGISGINKIEFINLVVIVLTTFIKY